MIHPKKLVALALMALPAVLCFWLTGCNDNDDPPPVAFNYEYYPLDSGKYVVYQVDSISSYRQDFKKDTGSYQLMEVIGDTFYDNQNELNYEINLYRRPDGSSPWNFDRKWFVKRTVTNLQKIEDDIRFVKLVFPPTIALGWDGNIFIPSSTDPYRAFENWDYHYEGVNVPGSFNGFNFDSTLNVVAVNDSNFIQRRKMKESYAKNVGLVYREWDIQTGSGVNFWEGPQWNGFKIKMRLIDHN